jgi:hypothetical protein
MWRDASLVKWTPEVPYAINWDGIVGGSPRNSMAASGLNRLTRGQQPGAGGQIHVGVGGAVGFGMIFPNVVEKGFAEAVVLTEDEDAVLSMAAADFNFDGKDELLLGTFGGKILIFGETEKDGEERWELKKTLSLGAPIHCFSILRSIDVVPYLLVGTQRSLEVLAPPLRVMEKVLMERLDELAAPNK